MNKIVRKIAVVVGTLAVSVGIMGATTVAAEAGTAGPNSAVQKLDSSWGR